MIILDSIEFMETETLVKRVALALGIVIIAAATAGVVWYNLNLKDEFVEGKTETNYLRQETSRLGAYADTLRTEVETKARELKNSITTNKDFTQKVETEVTQTKIFTREVQQEQSKFQNEATRELSKLHDSDQVLQEQLRNKEQELKTEIARLRKEVQSENDKLKESISMLNDQLKSKDVEITELKSKLAKEIEFRNRYFINR